MAFTPLPVETPGGAGGAQIKKIGKALANTTGQEANPGARHSPRQGGRSLVLQLDPYLSGHGGERCGLRMFFLTQKKPDNLV